MDYGFTLALILGIHLVLANTKISKLETRIRELENEDI